LSEQLGPASLYRFEPIDQLFHARAIFVAVTLPLAVSLTVGFEPASAQTPSPNSQSLGKHYRPLGPPSHGAKVKNLDVSAAASAKGVRVIQDGDLVAVLHATPDGAEAGFKGKWVFVM
jgi:hypothetical protein